MKTILNIFNSTFRVLFGIIILGLILMGVVLLIWGLPGTSYDLTEKYFKSGMYSIGKQQYYNNICHKEKGCFNGEILGLNKEDNDIYIYIKTNYSTIQGLNNNEVFGYSYELYKNIDTITVKELNQLPKFGYLNGNKLKLYSENDLKNLTQEQQHIFKELEQNPRIIIDGVDYSK